MKHKLLPTMIGAVLASGMGAAQADITVFGHLDTAIVNTDRDQGWRNMHGMPGTSKSGASVSTGRGWFTSGGGESAIDDSNFKCTTCSIGFKGSEDLGNGLKVIFKLDFQFDMFERDKTSFTDRDQWLGLKGNFGQVRWGTISTPYKSHGKLLDPLYRTAAQGRGLGLQSYLHNGATEDGGGRSTNTVRWDSPSWNGLKVAAFYTLDSDEFDGVNRNQTVLGGTNPLAKEDDNPFGIGAQYTNGGILVFADYLTNNGDDAKTGRGDLSAWKIGGKYKLNNFAVMAQYEDIEQNIYDDGFGTYGSGRQEGTWWHVAGSYTMGNNMVYLGYGQSAFDDIDNYASSLYPDDIEADAFTIAGTHKLSKRTMIYAAYNMQTQDADVGINLDKNCDSSTGASCGDVDKTTIAIGMKHKF